MRMTSDEIRDSADELMTQAMRELCRLSGLKARTNPQMKDKGIDFFIEIETRDQKPRTVESFFLQNKGKESELMTRTKGAHKGEIALKLDDARQLAYWCNELDQPVIVTYCDLKRRSIYWHPIQLHKAVHLKEIDRVENLVQHAKRRTSSIQIFFDPQKIIMRNAKVVVRSVDKFLEDVVLCKRKIHQEYSFGEREYYRYGPGQEALNDVLKELGPLEAIDKLIQKFRGINVIPDHVYTKLYPFFTGGGTYSRYHNYTLYTDNETLIDELLKYGRVDHKLRYKSNGRPVDKKQASVVERVIRFFYSHEIWHIDLHRKFNRRVHVHRLFLNESCNCAKCLFSRSDYQSAIEKTKKIGSPSMFQVYMYAQIGESIQSYDTLKALQSIIEKDGTRKAEHVLACYSLYLLRFGMGYIQDVRMIEIQKELSKLDPYNVLLSVKNELHGDLYEALRYIVQENYMTWKFEPIMDAMADLRSMLKKDHRGAYITGRVTGKIFNYVARIKSFTELNHLYYSRFANFMAVVHELFEACCLSFQIVSESNTRITELNDKVIAFFANHAEPRRLKEILYRTNTSSIPYNRGSDRPSVALDVRLKSYAKSVPFLNKYFADLTEKNYQLESKLNNVFQAYLIFLRVLDVETGLFNRIYRYFLDIVENAQFLHPIAYQEFQTTTVSKQKEIKGKLIVRFVNIRLHETRNANILHEMDIKPVLWHKSLRKVRKDVIDQLVEYYGVNDLERSPEDLVEVFDIATSGQKKAIKNIISDYLGRKFIFQLCHLSVMYDIVKYTRYEDACIQFVTIKRQEISLGVASGKKSGATNQYWDDLINMCFHAGVDLRQGKYQKCKPEGSYYEWLMDMKGFDYNEFDPMWLLEYTTHAYIEKFKSIPQVKNELLQAIKRKSVEGLSSLYLHHFTKADA